MQTEFLHDGHTYKYDLNTMYGTNKEKLVVWDVEDRLIGDVTIDHNIEQLYVDLSDDSDCDLCSATYFAFVTDYGRYDYLQLAKFVITIDS